MTAPVVFTADKATAPTLIRAHRRGRLIAYAVLDQFGWAIVAPRLNPEGHRVMSTVDRYTVERGLGETTYTLLPHALIGLNWFVLTGRTGES